MPPAALRVRDAAPADAPRIAELVGQLGYPSAPAEIVARLAALRATGARALVAETEAGVCGLVTLHWTTVLHRPQPDARIGSLVVLDGSRGAGVGRALVEAVERIVRECGGCRLEVTSGLQRAAAHAFYEHVGYVHTSRRFLKEWPGGSSSGGRPV
ncbi:MAG TPA: GNAT family N-acetyltransferase [Gemmatimonadales bacterium]|nr:GNAT family N-acetyltransferase [Gemmatimonadales bacterium]